MSESRLAKSARLSRHELEVDGETFPFYIAERGVTVEASTDDIAVLKVSILIDGPVSIDLDPEEAEPEAWTPFDGTPEPKTETSDEEREQVERWQGGDE